MGDAVPLPADRLQLCAAALVRAGDLPAAADCYQQAVSAAPDDWLSWQLYLDCMLPASTSGSSGSGGGSRFPVGVVGGLADIWDRQQRQQQASGAGAGAGSQDTEALGASLAAVEDSVRQLSAEVAGNDGWRQQCDKGTLSAPLLWRCELLLRRQRLGPVAGPEEQQQEQMGAAVAEAFAKLAANFSCVNDLRPYLAALSGAAAEQLAADVHRLSGEQNIADTPAASGDSSNNSNGGSGSAAAGEVRRLQRLVNAHQIEQELGLPRFASPEEAVAHARRLLSLYRQHMHLSGAQGRKGHAGFRWLQLAGWQQTASRIQPSSAPCLHALLIVRCVLSWHICLLPHAAGLDEKERGYGEELVVAAVDALMRGRALEAAPERAAARMLQVRWLAGGGTAGGRVGKQVAAVPGCCCTWLLLHLAAAAPGCLCAGCLAGW